MAVFLEPNPRCTDRAVSVGLKQLQGDCLVGFGILGYFRDEETFFSVCLGSTWEAQATAPINLAPSQNSVAMSSFFLSRSVCCQEK